MAFGLNQVQLIGRLGRDVEVRHTKSGGKVANLNLATDESYIDRNSGQKADKAEWHRVVSFQDGVVEMLQKARHQGPPGLRLRQAADQQVEGPGRQRPVHHRDPDRPRRARPVPRQDRQSPGARAARHQGRCRPGPRQRRRTPRTRASTTTSRSEPSLPLLPLPPHWRVVAHGGGPSFFWRLIRSFRRANSISNDQPGDGRCTATPTGQWTFCCPATRAT